MSKQIEIKIANIQDLPLILEFIKELADYEKLLHEVVATEDSLRATLFGDPPYAEVIIAYLNEVPVGFALFFHNYSTFLAKPGIYIEDLYVRAGARGKGVGKQILIYLAQLAEARNCGRLQWCVLDWNETAIHFYKSIGAKSVDDWTIYRVEGESLHHLATSTE